MTATANFLQTTINGFDVEVYSIYEADEFFIMKDGVQIHGQRVNKGQGLLRATEKVAQLSGVEVKPVTKTEKLEKGRLVLMSAHIQEVEVTFLSEIHGSRYYQIRTWNGRHQYQARFFEQGGERKGICNCVSQKTCRHLIRAAAVDSQLHGVDMHFESISNYKAHRRAA